MFLVLLSAVFWLSLASASEALAQGLQGLVRKDSACRSFLKGTNESKELGGGGAGASMQVWAALVEKLVKRKWSYPPVANSPRLVCQVEMQIGPDGSIEAARVVQFSGRADFDNSALRAVKETENLPKPPSASVNKLTLCFDSQEKR